MKDNSFNNFFHSDLVTVKQYPLLKKFWIDLPDNILKPIEFEPQMKILFYHSTQNEIDSFKILILPNRRKKGAKIFRLKFSVSDQVGALSELAYILYKKCQMNILVSHLVSTIPGKDATWIIEAEFIDNIQTKFFSIEATQNEISKIIEESKKSIKSNVLIQLLSIEEINLNFENFEESNVTDEILKTFTGNNRIAFKDTIYTKILEHIKQKPLFAIVYTNEKEGSLLVRFLRTEKLLKIHFHIKDEPGAIYKISYFLKNEELDIKHAFSNMLNYKNHGNYINFYVDYSGKLKLLGGDGQKEKKKEKKLIKELNSHLLDLKDNIIKGYEDENINTYNDIIDGQPQLTKLPNDEKRFIRTIELITNYISTQKSFWLLLLVGFIFSYIDCIISIPEKSNDSLSFLLYFLVKSSIYVPIFIGAPQICKSLLNIKKWL